MTGLDEMKKYLKPSYFYLYASTGFLFLGLLIGIKAKDITVMLIFVGIAVLNSITTVSQIITLNGKIRQYTANGSSDMIIREFQNARSFADGHLRMSHSHIFGERSGTILEYQEIAKVYQFIHKKNFAENSRELRVQTTDGKTVSLCKLQTGGKSDQSVSEAVAVMQKHNPRIRIGYR